MSLNGAMNSISVGATSILVGLALAAGSFFIKPATGHNYSEVEAKQYQSVSKKLHGLSGKFASAEIPSLELKKEMAAAQKEFAERLERLEKAKNSGLRLRNALLFGGVALVILGAVIALRGQPEK